MVEVYAMNIRESICKEKYEKWLSIISEEKRNQISRFVYKEDKLRSLYGEIIVRHVLLEKNIKLKEINFVKNKFGKPFIKNCYDFFFNISHSADWVVCAFGNKEVGIDIEEIKPMEIDIPKRFFSKDEYRELSRKPEKDQIGYFYDLWTLKESYIKWLGVGLEKSLDTCVFSIDADIISFTSDNMEQLNFKQLNFDGNYKIAICSEELCVLETINYIYNQDIKID